MMSYKFLIYLTLVLVIYTVEAASARVGRQPLKKGSKPHTTIVSKTVSRLSSCPASRVPVSTKVPALPTSTVKCLDGSKYLGPDTPCRLPMQKKLLYAAAPEYQQYIVTGNQPKFHLEGIAELVDERVDPIISPGQTSGHSHTIFGGQNFGPILDYAQTQLGKCSTVSVQGDKSNYWVPSVYVQRDGVFYRQSLAQRFYYLMHHWTINAPPGMRPFEETIHAFPPGFRQMIGNPNRKTVDENSNISHRSVGTYWCFAADGQVSRHKTFPKGCDSIKITTVMPACWDGNNLWLRNSAHMAWPVNFQNEPQEEGGFCPETHPVRLPQVLFESTIWLSWTKGKYDLILANGDTTGAGMHADFFNGWNTEMLQAGINEAYVKGYTPATSKYLDLSSSDMASFKNPVRDLLGLLMLSKECRFTNKVVFPGVANPYNVAPPILKALPGCNKPWRSGPKPSC